MSSIMPSITLSEQYNSESMIPILNVNADAETDDWCEHILSFLQQTFPFMDFELAGLLRTQARREYMAMRSPVSLQKIYHRYHLRPKQ